MQDVTRNIDLKVERELWAKAAGRCEFNGCNRILYKSSVTQERVNISEKAHIYSFSEKGPRGRGCLKDTPKKLNEINNLMLVCHDCHKLIDQDKEGHKYSASLLQQWKREHEQRIRMVTGIIPNRKSHVVFYGSNIGDQQSPLHQDDAMAAMFPDYYPVSDIPIELSMACSHKDKDPAFWQTESDHLLRSFDRKILQLIEKQDAVKHFSLFCLAGMPLLIKFGTLFTDKIPVETYQLMREPRGWQWQGFPEGFKFIINEPMNPKSQPVLIISISDTINHGRITKVLGDDISIWELTVPVEHIGNDNIRHKEQLSMMRTIVRQLMVLIKREHDLAPLSIFPAMSVACSIELGRARMPKADMPWIIYDQNNDAGGFIKTITIGETDDF